jgi:catechol 2,3-dioxygenase-like lactoylglutathione lyase family enzyme
MLASAPLYPVLPVSDLARAKAWYQDKLGLTPTMEDAERGTAIYQHAASVFLLYTSEFAGTNQATAAGFLVPNFDEIVDHLRTKGVTFEDVDFGGGIATVDGVVSSPDGSERSAWFKDSEGNILSIATADTSEWDVVSA